MKNKGLVFCTGFPAQQKPKVFRNQLSDCRNFRGKPRHTKKMQFGGLANRGGRGGARARLLLPLLALYDRPWEKWPQEKAA